MAAEALGLPPFSVSDLVEEMVWPPVRVNVGIVEMAGGVRSPQASDGDATHVLAALDPDVVVLVADAGLGTINAVRLSMEALATAPLDGEPVRPVVVLDRYDGHHDIHRRNREWLAERDGYDVVTLPGEEQRLADLVWKP
jgi:dethiobiotin synthetase